MSVLAEQYRPADPVRRNPRHHSFIISPAKSQDIPCLVDIEFWAFRNETTNHILSYRDRNQPSHLARAEKSYKAAMRTSERGRRKSTSGRRTDRRNNAIVRFHKVTEAETGAIISWAKTEMKAYDEAELASPLDSGHEGEATMNRKWFALNEDLRRSYVGTDRHCYISMLATEPNWQHRGAGTMLLKSILAEADEAGVECYLEATDTARPLYEKHGFVMVNEMRFDPAEFGLSGFAIERQTIMVRGAVGADGYRKPVRSWNEVVGSTSTPASESESESN